MAYLSLREALGFQMRAEKTLLPDFVACVKVQGSPGPIRAQLALEWAGQKSARRGTKKRCRSAPQYGTRVSHPTSVPPRPIPTCQRRGLVPSPTATHPIPVYAHAADSPLGGGSGESSARIVTLPHLIHLSGLLASTGLRVGEAIRLQVDHVNFTSIRPS